MTAPLDVAAVARLEQTAEKATPGPWRASAVAATAGATVRTRDGNRPIARLVPDDRDELGIPGKEGAKRAGTAIAQTRADAEFIAAASPDVVAGLCARVRELETALETIAKRKRVTWPTSEPLPTVIDGKPTFVEYVRHPEPWEIAEAALAVSRPGEDTP